MTERTRKKQARAQGPSLARTNPGTSPGRQFVQRRIARMGNSTVKSHQATEVRLKSRRKVNRPLRPIPSRAIEAGSGITVVVVEKPWLVKEKVAPLVPPSTVMSFSTKIEVSGGVNGVVSIPCPMTWNGLLLS